MSPMEPWHKIPIATRAYLGHVTFYEDETRDGVCPYADQRGDLSFAVRVSEFCVICDRILENHFYGRA